MNKTSKKKPECHGETHDTRCCNPAISSTPSARSSRCSPRIFSLPPEKMATVDAPASHNSIPGDAVIPSPANSRAADRLSWIAGCNPGIPRARRQPDRVSNLCKREDCCCCCCCSCESIRSPPFLRSRCRHPHLSRLMSTRLRRCFLEKRKCRDSQKRCNQ